MIYRVYYNNSTDRQRWSVDEGHPKSEITVMSIVLRGVDAVSETKDGAQPTAWLSVQGDLMIRDGAAIFTNGSA